MKLCDPCRRESERWLDYQPFRKSRFANNAYFDDTSAGMREIRRGRFEDWRSTVRFQQDLIREQCAREHQGSPLHIGSLFTGFGGLDMAVRSVFGGELAWVSDNHPSAVKLLAHRCPNVANLGDITAVEWEQVERVAAIVAGFPCTDISTAGLQAGIEGVQSGLWSYVVDAVRVLRPRHVYLENVSTIVVRGLDRVAADLAALGYDLRWVCLRASAVGAPHLRHRWFGYATPSDAYCAREQQRRRHVANVAGRPDDGTAEVDWGQFGPAIHRWEGILGRRAPEPTQAGRGGSRVLSPRFVEWMQGVEPGWVTDVPGLSRSDMLRLLGNGVVPQQGEAALRWLVAQELREAA